ncbi:ABC transporter substrate-binding protein [Methylocystis sp. IM2]
MNADRKLRIGFIPLVDAAPLLVAVDKGFAAEEGLDVELVQEVSWSNIRDRLSIGQSKRRICSLQWRSPRRLA